MRINEETGLLRSAFIIDVGDFQHDVHCGTMSILMLTTCDCFLGLNVHCAGVTCVLIRPHQGLLAFSDVLLTVTSQLQCKSLGCPQDHMQNLTAAEQGTRQLTLHTVAWTEYVECCATGVWETCGVESRNSEYTTTR